MDGFETATLIRQRERSAHTPIIFVTAFSEEMQVARGYSLGAVDYILAPVVPEILRTKVAVLVDLYRVSDEVRRQAESLRRRTRQLHQLTIASLAINSAESTDAMTAISTTSAVDILEAQLAETTAAIDQHSIHYVAGPARGATPLGAAPSPVGPEVRRSNRTAHTSWEHDGNPPARARCAPGRTRRWEHRRHRGVTDDRPSVRSGGRGPAHPARPGRRRSRSRMPSSAKRERRTG
jgi:CheY-like chemotaxis protein